ncbi:Hypothetical Protein FCC1311_058172 [Hondaea fermentalgiana]|uniref:Uncharacterized protein n=1 Tax=Hondaea fermentalgiana TaxID=2315210 RepID=A0A2R5GF83_9STRA|nr:Hypothetical Protein FCC1311_058172 [Hondaea fermentalgiana]|eukprot:GBG29596.1 Hypothetical Protein FCC1311_058172 [Hondaea fermentalgiana]
MDDRDLLALQALESDSEGEESEGVESEEEEDNEVWFGMPGIDPNDDSPSEEEIMREAKEYIEKNYKGTWKSVMRGGASANSDLMNMYRDMGAEYQIDQVSIKEGSRDVWLAALVHLMPQRSSEDLRNMHDLQVQAPVFICNTLLHYDGKLMSAFVESALMKAVVCSMRSNLLPLEEFLDEPRSYRFFGDDKPLKFLSKFFRQRGQTSGGEEKMAEIIARCQQEVPREVVRESDLSASEKEKAVSYVMASLYRIMYLTFIVIVDKREAGDEAVLDRYVAAFGPYLLDKQWAGMVQEFTGMKLSVLDGRIPVQCIPKRYLRLSSEALTNVMTKMTIDGKELAKQIGHEFPADDDAAFASLVKSLRALTKLRVEPKLPLSDLIQIDEMLRLLNVITASSIKELVKWLSPKNLVSTAILYVGANELKEEATASSVGKLQLFTDAAQSIEAVDLHSFHVDEYLLNEALQVPYILGSDVIRVACIDLHGEEKVRKAATPCFLNRFKAFYAREVAEQNTSSEIMGMIASMAGKDLSRGDPSVVAWLESIGPFVLGLPESVHFSAMEAVRRFRSAKKAFGDSFTAEDFAFLLQTDARSVEENGSTSGPETESEEEDGVETGAGRGEKRLAEGDVAVASAQSAPRGKQLRPNKGDWSWFGMPQVPAEDEPDFAEVLAAVTDTLEGQGMTERSLLGELTLDDVNTLCDSVHKMHEEMGQNVKPGSKDVWLCALICACRTVDPDEPDVHVFGNSGIGIQLQIAGMIDLGKGALVWKRGFREVWRRVVYSMVIWVTAVWARTGITKELDAEMLGAVESLFVSAFHGLKVEMGARFLRMYEVMLTIIERWVEECYEDCESDIPNFQRGPEAPLMDELDYRRNKTTWLCYAIVSRGIFASLAVLLDGDRGGYDDALKIGMCRVFNRDWVESAGEQKIRIVSKFHPSTFACQTLFPKLLPSFFWDSRVSDFREMVDILEKLSLHRESLKTDLLANHRLSDDSSAVRSSFIARRQNLTFSTKEVFTIKGSLRVLVGLGEMGMKSLLWCLEDARFSDGLHRSVRLEDINVQSVDKLLKFIHYAEDIPKIDREMQGAKPEVHKELVALMTRWETTKGLSDPARLCLLASVGVWLDALEDHFGKDEVDAETKKAFLGLFTEMYERSLQRVDVMSRVFELGRQLTDEEYQEIDAQNDLVDIEMERVCPPVLVRSLGESFGNIYFLEDFRESGHHHLDGSFTVEDFNFLTGGEASDSGGASGATQNKSSSKRKRKSGQKSERASKQKSSGENETNGDETEENLYDAEVRAWLEELE